MREVIYVLSDGTKWKVLCKHCNKYWLFEKQADAIARARDHVGVLPQGTLSQILVQGQDGKFRTEWTYNKDPFPPRG